MAGLPKILEELEIGAVVLLPNILGVEVVGELKILFCVVPPNILEALDVAALLKIFSGGVLNTVEDVIAGGENTGAELPKKFEDSVAVTVILGEPPKTDALVFGVLNMLVVVTGSTFPNKDAVVTVAVLSGCVDVATPPNTVAVVTGCSGVVLAITVDPNIELDTLLG